MQRTKLKEIVKNTEEVVKDTKTKYDFINDKLIEDIEQNTLNVDDVFNIISVLRTENFYNLPNLIVPIRDSKELEMFEWNVGDVVIYLDNSFTYNVFLDDLKQNWLGKFVLFHYKNEQTMLFANCLGNPISSNLEKLILASKYIPKAICIKSNLTKNADYNHLMAISNIEGIVDVTVESFENYSGFSQHEAFSAFRERLLHTLKCLLLTNNIYEALEQIQDKLEFIAELKTFIHDCLEYARLRDVVNEFHKIQIEESEKYESTGSMDVTRIEAARKKMKSETSRHNKIQVNPTEEHRLQIERKFPEESECFHKIFENLSNYKINDQYMQAIKMISEKLDLNYDDLKIFCDENQKREKSEEKIEQVTSEPTETAQSSEDLILQRYTENVTVNPTVNSSVRSLSELLTDIKKLNNFSTDEMNNLKALYDSVTLDFAENWANETARNIREWAKKVRGSQENICEAIAVCKRAHEIVSKGEITLRDVQILSLLMYLRTNRGNFAEIATGEGKTILVATLAVIKILQGMKSVDVITSNEVLAAEGVGNTTDFYYLFDVLTGHNNFDATNGNGARECYKFDIVYGNISNFQFDYLRDSFEGYGTRAGRAFDFVILDEADCLTVDNGCNIAKLAQSFPGIESLRYIYIKIWVLLNKVEETYMENFRNDMRKNDDNKTDEQLKQAADEYLAERKKDMYSELKQLIQTQNILHSCLIPQHLNPYCSSMLDKWIDNAIYAKYNCHEKEAYILKTISGEEMVVPVDYANTGMSLANTVCANGLHQFIQLKHNLRVTTDSLTASFISNIGYLRLYKNNMYGMTGTLGSVAEQIFLSSVYSLQYVRVPPFKPKQFTEYDCIVVKDHEWANCVIMNAYMLVKQKRSVLIICKTISDVELLRENLKLLLEFEDAKNWINERYYYDETYADLVIRNKVGPCEIIISTNIAGRGTDFNTTPQLESNGGLHVCVAYLPCNERVGQQAFGRTSRMGNKGTAQLLLKESDVEEINYEITDSTTTEDIKAHRNKIESTNLVTIQRGKLAIIVKQDEIFQQFVNTYREFANPENIYLCMDLKERWAFWLRSKKFDGSEEVLYDEFLTLAQPILDGQVSFNPFYEVLQADCFLRKGDVVKAKESLNHALTISASAVYMYPVYMKLFDANIMSGYALYNRFIRILKKIAFFKPDNEIENPKYKEEALAALEGADKSITVEINYIYDNILENDDFQLILSGPSHSEINSQNNILLKHIFSRYHALLVFQKNIKSLILTLKDIKEDATIHRIENFHKNLDSKKPDEQRIKRDIHKKELDELSNVGLSSIYLIREVFDVSDTLINSAKVQIGAGIALNAACFFFPPALVFGGPASILLISEGIFDIIWDLMGLGTTKFDTKEYAQRKFINFIIALGGAIATGGLLFIKKNFTNMVQVIEKVAVQGIQKLAEHATLLSNFWKVGAQWCIKHVHGIITFINKVKMAIDIGRDLKMRLKRNGCGHGNNFASSLVGQFVIMKNIQIILKASEPHTLEIVNRVVMETFGTKLESLSLVSIKSTVETEAVEEESWEIFAATVADLIKPRSFWNVPNDNYTLFSIEEGEQLIVTFATDICQKINNLVPNDETVRNSETEIKEIQSFLREFIADNLYERIITLAYGTALSSQSKVSMNQSFLGIANAYKQLGLHVTANINVIENRCSELKVVHLPGSRKLASAEMFLANQKAKDVLINFHNSIAVEPIIELDLPITDKRNLEILSQQQDIHIVVEHEDARKETHFGSNNGDVPLMLSYRAPTATNPGQYFLTGLTTAFRYTTHNNCLYDCLALLLSERGFPVTSSMLRIDATMPSLEHLKYEENDFASLFHHPYTARVYLQIEQNMRRMNCKPDVN